VFVSSTEISYATASGLYRAPLSGSPKTLVTKESNGGIWNRDGSAVVYPTFVDFAKTTLHQFRDGHDQVLGTVPGGGGGGCEYLANCQIPNFLDFQLVYSPDGTVISLVTTGFTGSSFRIWSSGGANLKSSDERGATMSTWSGNGLYFRDAKGVEVWRNGVTSSFLPGVQWNKPHGSPAGGQIVYAVPDSSGWNHAYVVDTTTKKIRELKKGRSGPVFLTSRFIWYEGERACVPSDECGPTPPFHPASGKTYIYDLATGTEFESIITGVSDAWPHAA
jgi:hypothetical protein